MIFFHHIYCAQLKVKWGGGHGENVGHAPPQAPHSYSTDAFMLPDIWRFAEPLLTILTDQGQADK